jgi:hypothetical protein
MNTGRAPMSSSAPPGRIRMNDELHGFRSVADGDLRSTRGYRPTPLAGLSRYSRSFGAVESGVRAD